MNGTMKDNIFDNHQLIDALGRRISYIRISVTERCNFHCKYCYTPSSDSTHGNREIRAEEVLHLVSAFSLLKVDKVRITGGEPLLRSEIVSLVEGISRIEGISLIGLTTNGYMLSQKLPQLIDAGLNRLNISLDSLNPETFHNITGHDGLHRVLEVVDTALDSGAFPHVKINTILMRGINDNEVSDFAAWALPREIDLRFIEYMPTQDNSWGNDRFFSESEVRERLKLDLIPDMDEANYSGPAVTYRVKGYPGRISFISAVSHSFCKACNRLRVISSGDMVGCLFRTDRVNLLSILENSNSPEEIASFIREAVSGERFRQIPDIIGGDYRPAMKAVGG